MPTIQDSVRGMIQKTLRSLGITFNYQGYYQVAYAIELVIEDKNRLLDVTQQIYQRVADRHDNSWSAIERNIRTVVVRAWKINPELLTQIANYPLSEAPTATEFIEMIAIYLLRRLPEELQPQMYGIMSEAGAK